MFSKPGTYPACGMFNITHYIAMIICFSLVITFVILSRKITKDKMNKVTKITALVILTLEIIKMSFCFLYPST